MAKTNSRVLIVTADVEWAKSIRLPIRNLPGAFALLKSPGKSPETLVNHLTQHFAKTPIHSYLKLFKESCIDQL